MLKFLIKKTFFNMWDNLLFMILLNTGFTILVIAGLGLAYVILWAMQFFVDKMHPLAGLILGHFIFFPAACLFFVYAGVVSSLTRELADNKKADLKHFLTYLKETYKPSLLFSLINFILLFIFLVAGNYYLGTTDSLLNLTIFFVLVWVSVFWLSASQYFFALQSRFDKKVKKNIRKMLLLLIDNTAFTLLGLLLGTMVMLGLGALTLFTLCGFATILLWYNVALRLRLYKYEYLEKNPDANRRKIPWDILLAEEKKLLGKRTLRSIYFPEKE